MENFLAKRPRYTTIAEYDRKKNELLFAISAIEAITNSKGPWVIGNIVCNLCFQEILSISDWGPWIGGSPVQCDNCEKGQLELKGVY